jgi:hypothetical protein
MTGMNFKNRPVPFHKGRACRPVSFLLQHILTIFLNPLSFTAGHWFLIYTMRKKAGL